MQRNLNQTIFCNYLLGALLFLLLAGCQSAYYAVWEKMGVEKRDILVDRVEDGKKSQQQAQQQFSSALEQLSLLISFDGGELELIYKTLKADYEASQLAADNVSVRIDKIEDVAEALFDEWQNELDAYSSAKLRADSEAKLIQTKQRYQRLLTSMQQARAKMQPVLAALQDNVLYLKHNLNAGAIGALQQEFNDIKRDIDGLMVNMNQAINESNSFVKTLTSEGS